jgi:predicted NBD/HSP70 family sugar kinase
MTTSHRFVGNAAFLARINRSSILRLTKQQGRISRAEIASVLGLNPSTVGRIVSQLLEQNLLLELGPAPSKIGRRATVLQYNQKAGLVIGLDLSGRRLLGVLADLGGDFVRRVERPASTTRDPQENLDRVVQIVDDLLSSSPDTRQAVRSIGVAGYSVIVNPDGIVRLTRDLGWRDVPLKSLLEKRFGYPVLVQNESNLGALAESVWGVGQGVKRMVWLNAGVGLGSGIVIDGRLYEGAHGAAGEVGNMLPDVSSLRTAQASRGCMDALGSCSAMLSKARDAVEAGDDGWLATAIARNGELRTADVFEAARLKDPLALRLIDEMSDYLSLVLAGMLCVLDPDLVVLGQELAAGADLFAPRVASRIKDAVEYMPRIEASRLEGDAIIMGAVALALQSTEDQFYVTHPAFSEISTV